MLEIELRADGRPEEIHSVDPVPLTQLRDFCTLGLDELLYGNLQSREAVLCAIRDLSADSVPLDTEDVSMRSRLTLST